MEFKQISDACYYFSGAVNIGYVHNGEKGMLIDSGIDKSTANKVLRKLEEKQLPLTHLFITHAHSDHFGGAACLQKKTDVYTLAPFFEEAILRYPKLEPMYLFQGNNPPKEMRNKFLEGPPIRVDQVCHEGVCELEYFSLELFYFPGHSDFQLGVRVDNVLFAADSYFSKDQLDKHKIPFMIDIGEGLDSLEKLKDISCNGAVPGHGEYEENFLETVIYNIDYHKRILLSILDLFRERPEGFSHEDIVSRMCLEWEVPANNPSSWTLFRTAVTAYLKKHVDDNRVRMELHDYKLWYVCEEGS